jgi:hypothetical protein
MTIYIYTCMVRGAYEWTDNYSVHVFVHMGCSSKRLELVDGHTHIENV